MKHSIGLWAKQLLQTKGPASAESSTAPASLMELPNKLHGLAERLAASQPAGGSCPWISTAKQSFGAPRAKGLDLGAWESPSRVGEFARWALDELPRLRAGNLAWYMGEQGVGVSMRMRSEDYARLEVSGQGGAPIELEAQFDPAGKRVWIRSEQSVIEVDAAGERLRERADIPLALDATGGAPLWPSERAPRSAAAPAPLARPKI